VASGIQQSTVVLLVVPWLMIVTGAFWLRSRWTDQLTEVSTEAGEGQPVSSKKAAVTKSEA
jgi:hypothetical protein